MIRECFDIDKAQDAEDKAMELVYRTEDSIYVLACPKDGLVPDRYLQAEEVEWMVVDAEGVTDLVGMLYAQYYLVENEDGTYAVAYVNLVKKRKELDDELSND